jgi:hypothetical protein
MRISCTVACCIRTHTHNSIAEFADRESMERAQREYDDTNFGGGSGRIRVDLQVNTLVCFRLLLVILLFLLYYHCTVLCTLYSACYTIGQILLCCKYTSVLRTCSVH